MKQPRKRLFLSKDLPFHEDDTTRFLPWLVAVMLFLLILALTSFLVVNKAIDRWHSSLKGLVTVQIAPLNDNSLEHRTTEVMAFLQRQAGVKSAEIISDDHAKDLLKPWFGDNVDLLDLPMPRLIDVRLKTGHSINVIDWNTELSVIEGIAVDDHNTWLMGLIRFGQSLQYSSLFVLLAVGAAALLMIIYTTRTGLAVHQDVIEVLHLIGARDNYIARQFQLHAFLLTLKGSMIGTAIGMFTVLVVSLSGQAVDSLIFPDTTLSLRQWGLLLATPVLMAMLATLTARYTVLKSLRRMI